MNEMGLIIILLIVVFYIIYELLYLDAIFHLGIVRKIVDIVCDIEEKLYKPTIKITKLDDNARYEVGKNSITVYSPAHVRVYTEFELRTFLIIDNQYVPKAKMPEIELYQKFGIKYELKNIENGSKEAKLLIKNNSVNDHINYIKGDKLFTLHYPCKKIKVIEKGNNKNV